MWSRQDGSRATRLSRLLSRLGARPEERALGGKSAGREPADDRAQVWAYRSPRHARIAGGRARGRGPGRSRGPARAALAARAGREGCSGASGVCGRARRQALRPVAVARTTRLFGHWVSRPRSARRVRGGGAAEAGGWRPSGWRLPRAARALHRVEPACVDLAWRLRRGGTARGPPLCARAPRSARGSRRWAPGGGRCAARAGAGAAVRELLLLGHDWPFRSRLDTSRTRARMDGTAARGGLVAVAEGRGPVAGRARW